MSQSFDTNCAKKTVEIQQQWWIIARSCLKVQKSRICRIGVRGRDRWWSHVKGDMKMASKEQEQISSAIYSAAWCFSLMVLNVVNQHFIWSIPVAIRSTIRWWQDSHPQMVFSRRWVLPRYRRKKTRSQKAGGKNQARRQNTSMNHLGITICRGWCTSLLNGQLRALKFSANHSAVAFLCFLAAICLCQASFALQRCLRQK